MKRLWWLWRTGRHDLRLVWFALRHPLRPVWLVPAAALLAVFALDPANLAIPFLGILDDFVVLPLLLHMIVRVLPSEVQASFQAQQPVR